MQNTTTDYQPAIEVRFPTSLHTTFGTHLAIWLLTRGLDLDGSGKATFSLEFAATTLNRSVSTIRRLIAGAKAKGLIHRITATKQQYTLYYASLERIAWNAQIDELGAIAEISLADLPHLNIVATEVTAQAIQRASYWKAKEATRKQKQAIKPIHPDDVLVKPPCGPLARVLGFSNDGRWMFVTEKFAPYGASIKTIAQVRGVHPRTAERHLSNCYRLNPSPVLRRRSDLLPIQKKQLAVRLPRHQGALVKMARKFRDLNDGRYFAIDDRVFYARCNLYYPTYTLVPCRRRRKRYKDFLCSENARRGEGEVLEVLMSGKVEGSVETLS